MKKKIFFQIKMKIITWWGLDFKKRNVLIFRGIENQKKKEE
jgi:hypothetical protein